MVVLLGAVSKSFALLLEPLRHISNPQFGAVIFRQTSTQIRTEGGLWDESAKLYPLVGARPRETYLEWVFPTGATVKFAYLEHENDKFNYQGAQIPFLGFDELTHFSMTQVFYMLSRNRSTCGVRPYVRGTCNPDADHWVADFIAWWIDQDTGFPIPERAGVIRHFARVNDQIIWGATSAEVKAFAPDTEIETLSFTFIPAKLSDNPALTRKDPSYLAKLMAEPLVERERLLAGNWKIRAVEGNIFRRAWFADQVVDATPRVAKRVRYWDKAGTPGGGKFTAGVLMSAVNSQYYVEDVIREQLGALDREALILDTAKADAAAYGNVETWVEQEPGSGGKESAEGTVKKLAGYLIHAERVTGDKLVRAGPYSAQCEGRNVTLKRAAWNSAYIEELVHCPSKYMDQVDASSGAFNKLALRGRPYNAASAGERTPATIYQSR